jgi:hypothetical protein
MIGCGRVLGIDAAYTAKILRIALQYIGKIAVVPTVVDYLDDHGPGNAIRLHESQQHLCRSVLRWNLGSRGKRKGRIVLPYVNMGINERSFRIGTLN